MPKKVAKTVTKIASILIRIPPNQARAGWDIDSDVLLDFARENGIRRNISIRWTSSHYVFGTQMARMVNGEWEHRITLSQIVDPETALRAILHELCHCIQMDEWDNPLDFDDEYKRFVGGGARNYMERNPYEIAAEDFVRNNRKKWSGLIY